MCGEYITDCTKYLRSRVPSSKTMAALTQLFYEDWANLPDPILTQIFSYLSEVERCRVGATCKHWLQCLETPQLWRTFNCVFDLPAHRKQVKCIKKYGHFVSRLTIYINHTQEDNRNSALAVFKHLSSLENVRLSYLSIVFNGSSVGDDYNFSRALQELLTKIGEKKEKSTLKHLNLPSFSGYFNDNLIDKISETCPNLEYLNLLNNYSECSFNSNRMVILALKCRKIQELHLYYTNLSDDVLKALSESGRKPILRLGIVCTGDDNTEILPEILSHDISSEAWSSLLTANPDLKVALKFDHGFPPHCISEIMKPEIPVQELHLNTFTPLIYQEITKAVAYYEPMLEKLIVTGDSSKQLKKSLLDAAQGCKKLRALYVYCFLDKDVIDRILQLCPLMRNTRDYILRWKNGPVPWLVKKEKSNKYITFFYHI